MKVHMVATNIILMCIQAFECRFTRTPSGVKIQELRVGDGPAAKQGDRHRQSIPLKQYYSTKNWSPPDSFYFNLSCLRRLSWAPHVTWDATGLTCFHAINADGPFITRQTLYHTTKRKGQRKAHSVRVMTSKCMRRIYVSSVEHDILRHLNIQSSHRTVSSECLDCNLQIVGRGAANMSFLLNRLQPDSRA